MRDNDAKFTAQYDDVFKTSGAEIKRNTPLSPDQAELSRLGPVTRSRLTQIMNLTTLAPDIQQAILFLPATQRGARVDDKARFASNRGACGLANAAEKLD